MGSEIKKPFEQGLWTPNEALLHQNANMGIWDIFKQFNSTHFDTVSPLYIFSINQPLFLQKTKPLNSNPKYLSGIGF